MMKTAATALCSLSLGAGALYAAPAHAMPGDRTDVSVGLSAGWSSLAQTPLSPAEGSLTEGAMLLEPFSAAPYTGVEQGAIDLELTWVFSHVRLSLGRRLPGSSFVMADTLVDLGDGRQALTRGLSITEWQVGLGGELPLPDVPVMPYLEVAGLQRRVLAEVALPEGMVDFEGRSFSFVGRAGVMVSFHEHGFVDLYGQSTLRGEPGWTVGLAVGAAMH